MLIPFARSPFALNNYTIGPMTTNRKVMYDFSIIKYWEALLMKSEIVLFETKDKEISLSVPVDGETVWLNQSQMTDLFNVDRSVITRHVNNIFKEEELIKKSNVQKMHIANSDRPVQFYSLDVIISVGYRVKSKRGTEFRQWANSVLKQYIIDIIVGLNVGLMSV